MWMLEIKPSPLKEPVLLTVESSPHSIFLPSHILCFCFMFANITQIMNLIEKPKPFLGTGAIAHLAGYFPNMLKALTEFST